MTTKNTSYWLYWATEQCNLGMSEHESEEAACAAIPAAREQLERQGLGCFVDEGRFEVSSKVPA